MIEVTMDWYDLTPENTWPFGLMAMVMSALTIVGFKFGLQKVPPTSRKIYGELVSCMKDAVIVKSKDSFQQATGFRRRRRYC